MPLSDAECAEGDAPQEPSQIFLSPPDVGELEETFVLHTLRSGWVAPAGPDLGAFEAELAERCGRDYGVAVTSGTAALHLALLELGVAAGSVVLVPTLTFVATANAVIYTGAIPVFVDCDPLTGNLDPTLLGEALATLRSEGTTVSAVVTVDLLGKCVDHDPIMEICGEYGVPVLEDAAEALGASSHGLPAGSFGAAAVLSFNGNKIMTTSGGGMLLTDDGRLAQRVRYLSTQARQPATHYEHTEMGFNYRMSNVLASIGRAQLQRLDAMIARRRLQREHYAHLFGHVVGVEIFQRAGDEFDNCWLTAILVDCDEAGWDPQDLAKALAVDNIESRPLWKPMHRQPVFSGARSFVTGAADLLFARGLALPSGSALTSIESQRVDTAITDFLADQR